MNKRLIAQMIATIGLASCGGYPAVQKSVNESMADAQARSSATLAKSPIATMAPQPVFVERTSKPFIAATSVARPTSERLPQLMQRVTINAPGHYNIQQAAQLITEATGIPVSLSPDVFQQPPGMTQQQQTTTLSASGLPPQSQQAQSILTAQIQQQYPITLGFRDTPMEQVLESVCAAANGLSYEFQDGRITIFRYMTRTYTLVVPAGQFKTEMTIGKTSTVATGTMGGGNNGTAQTTGSTNSVFSTTYTTEFKLMKELEDGVKSVLSDSGKAVVIGTSGTITVKDGRHQVEEVGRIVDDLNRVLMRQIYVRIEVLNWHATENAEAGVDWNLILSKVNSAGNNPVLSLISPTGSSSTTAGSVGVKLLRQVNGESDFSGTSALLRALNTIGNATIKRTWEGVALNRRVTPVASIRSTSYVAATTPATATAGGTGGVPGITPGVVSYGFVLNMIPTITNRNSLVLEFGMDLSDLNAIVPGTSGTGANQQTIELPDTIAQQLLQSPALETGDILIVSGLEQDTKNYNKRTLTRDGEPGFGGLFQGTQERQSLIVLITPVIANAGF